MKFKVGDKVWVLVPPLRPIIGTVSDVQNVLGYAVTLPAEWEFLSGRRHCEHELYSYPNEVDQLISRLRDIASDYTGFADKLEREIEDEKQRPAFDKEMYDEARAEMARENI